MSRAVLLALFVAAAPPDPPVAEPYLHEGNFVGVRFDGVGLPVARVDNISLLCPDSIARAQRRLRSGGLDVKSDDGRSQMINGAQADRMADQLDRMMKARAADIEILGIQFGYNKKRKVPRVTALCEGGLYEKLGLKRDDLILKVGDRVVRGRESAAFALEAHQKTPTANLTVRRNDDELVIDTQAQARAVGGLLTVMSQSLAMVPDPTDPFPPAPVLPDASAAPAAP